MTIKHSYAERRRYAKQFSKSERQSYKKGIKFGFFLGVTKNKRRKQHDLEKKSNVTKLNIAADSLKKSDLKSGSIRAKSYYKKQAKKIYK